MSGVEDLTRPDPAVAGRRRVVLVMAVVGALLCAGLVAVAVLDGGAPDYRLVQPTGDLSFDDGQRMSEGLPDIIRPGVDYPVRILVPPAAAGSQLEFTLFDRRARRLSTRPMGIALCGPSESPDTEPSPVSDR